MFTFDLLFKNFSREIDFIPLLLHEERLLLFFKMDKFSLLFNLLTSILLLLLFNIPIILFLKILFGVLISVTFFAFSFIFFSFSFLLFDILTEVFNKFRIFSSLIFKLKFCIV